MSTVSTSGFQIIKRTISISPELARPEDSKVCEKVESNCKKSQRCQRMYTFSTKESLFCRVETLIALEVLSVRATPAKTVEAYENVSSRKT